MRVELRDVSKGDALPAVSLAFETGSATLALTETERRPTVLGLLASGRMKSDTGTVTVDAHPDTARMRATIALVDAPVVSEPAADVTLAGIAAEELMFAGLPSNPFAVARRLDALGVGALAKTSAADLPALERIRVLCELALLRTGVEAIVLVSPDRHGGDPAEWWAYARTLAERGLAVLVIAGTAAASALAANDLIRESTAHAAQTAAADTAAAQTAAAQTAAAQTAAAQTAAAQTAAAQTAAAQTAAAETAKIAETAVTAADETTTACEVPAEPESPPAPPEPTPSDDGAGTDDDPTGDEK
ncbi:hypothetical protein HQQ80_20855 [Microbacteriaceae bacterium VKM Ac-2855]|nr:hypothetical protein [Microbacteriaceae bacterium VKM Ac-2855]